MKNKIEAIQEYIKKETANEFTGHDWFHVQRVLNNALNINEVERADEDVITLSCLLHDIGDAKVTGSEDTLLTMPKEVMDRFEINNDIQDKVLKIISEISFSGENTIPSSIE